MRISLMTTCESGAMPKRAAGPHERKAAPGGASKPGARTLTTIAGLELEVVRKRVKRLSLRVYPPDGHVRLTVPTHAKARDLEALIRERSDWIERHRRRFRTLAAAGEARYVAGETHYVRGRPYRLERSPVSSVAGARGRVSLELHAGSLLLQAPAGSTEDDLRRVFDAFYRRTLKAGLEPLVGSWEARLGRKVSAFGIKRMTTRWGSCNPRASRIWLNLELAKRRPELLEYVVVHELAHLYVPNHGADFKALMSRLLPSWRQLGAELDAWPIWARLPPP